MTPEIREAIHYGLFWYAVISCLQGLVFVGLQAWLTRKKTGLDLEQGDALDRELQSLIAVGSAMCECGHMLSQHVRIAGSEAVGRCAVRHGVDRCKCPGTLGSSPSRSAS
jgi:hypothetical protein